MLFFLCFQNLGDHLTHSRCSEVLTGCIDTLRLKAAPCLPRPHVEMPGTSQSCHPQSWFGFPFSQDPKGGARIFSPCHRIGPEAFGTAGTLGRNTAHLVTLGSQVDGKAR